MQLLNTEQSSTVQIVQTPLSKIQKKRQLKQLLKQTYKLGHNHITVEKVSEHNIKISEMFNGYYQEHTRYNVNNALDYIKYRKLQFIQSPMAQKSCETLQSKPYQLQKMNVNNLQDNIEKLIKKNITKEFLFHLEFNIKFDYHESSIDVHIEDGHVITIEQLQGNSIVTPITIHHNIDDKSIISRKHSCKQLLLAHICNLVYADSPDSSEFADLFFKYVICQKQLTKLYVEPILLHNLKIVDELSEFIHKGKVNDTYSYNLKSFEGFDRQLIVTKLTRVRTIVSIVARLDDIMFFEYRKIYSKISHNINANALEISALVQSHNY